jgi:cytochrome c-type biogenesis protein CcmF
MFISALGYILLILSILCFIGATAVQIIYKNKLFTFSKKIYLLGTGFIIASFINLEVAFISKDYAIDYVANNGSKHTPLLFTIAGVWSSLEGSLLLWITLMSVLFITFIFKTKNNPEVSKYAWPIISALIVFFTIMILFAANPFELGKTTPVDGLGPNPLLRENPLMATHPPLLYAGYVAMFFPWALSCAWLLSSKTKPVLKSSLMRDAIRWWSLVAFTLLSGGVLLGAWWSYEVLGWGGYWAWDPVENASIIPWIFSVILIHSTTMNSKYSQGSNSTHWFAFLCATGSILGTFLTRSGIVASVHAFSVSSIGNWLLILLGLCVFFGLYCLTTAKTDYLQKTLLWGSREKLYLASFGVLAALCAILTVGTIFPLISTQFLNQDVSVGAPYFNNVAKPGVVIILILLGLGNLSTWRNVSFKSLIDDKFVLYSIYAATGYAVLSVLIIKPLPWVTVMTTAAVFSFLATSFRIYAKIMSKRTVAKAISQLGMLAHMGFSLLVVFVLISSAYGQRQEIILKKNEPVKAIGSVFTLKNVIKKDNKDNVSYKALITIETGDSEVVAKPYVTSYRARNTTVGGPGIISNYKEDFYLHISSAPTNGEKITVVVQKKPGVMWVWYSGLLIVLGGLYATFRRRILSDTTRNVLGVVK